MIRYFVYDAEYDRDTVGHATYQAAERFDPDGIERLRDKVPRIEPRWVLKRPVAISWLVMQEEDGKLCPEAFRSIGLPEMTEAEMLGEFFSAVNALPSNVPIVTWGGSSSDEPQIRLAGLRHGLVLPNRFRVPFEAGKRHGHGHVDLMTHLCGDAARVHLAEICASLRIPAKVVAAPAATAEYREEALDALGDDHDPHAQPNIDMIHASFAAPAKKWAPRSRKAKLAASTPHSVGAYRRRLKSHGFCHWQNTSIFGGGSNPFRKGVRGSG